MIKIFSRIFIFIILISVLNAQENNKLYYPYSNSLNLSLGAGLTKGETDYPNSDFGILGKGSIEYFLKSHSPLSFGLFLDAGFSTIKGNGLKSPVPRKFKSTLLLLGLGVSANYKLTNSLVPFFSLGIQNSWIDVNQYSNLENPNMENATNKSTINFPAQFGLRYIISKFISVNAYVGLNFINADNIDGISFKNSNNDFFSTYNLSLSYAIDQSEENDKDGDGINDNIDNCPYQAEDFDGFEDDDGCPEFDNDGDGIVDSKDQCPNEAEDFDGFEDDDGCPEFDNDGDGIVDTKDQCPNEAEDFDVFKDDDGCPDLDNDNDGIIDAVDLCPDVPENFNNYEDNDGCPDTIPTPVIEEPKVEYPKTEIPKVETIKEKIETSKNNNLKNLIPSEFLIEGKSTFINRSAEIKNSAHHVLNQIAEQIKSNPGFRWRIEGHMDNSGTPFEVKALSTARANAIMEYFVSKGIPQNTFDVIGLGDKYPISSNSTAYGREKNRRVVIKRIK